MPRILSSRAAREQWRDLLDDAHKGESDTVIERNGRPVAAVIPFEDYEAMAEQLEELRVARRAQATLLAWRDNPALGRPYRRVREELVEEELLDE